MQVQEKVPYQGVLELSRNIKSYTLFVVVVCFFPPFLFRSVLSVKSQFSFYEK